MSKNSPRRELRRHELAVRGVGVVVVIALALTLAFLRSQGTIGSDPTVTAQLRNAGGSLVNGSDVKLAGVIIGRVSDIDRGPDGGVAIDLRLPPEDLANVPDNVVARILPATVFGTTYVDLIVYDKPSGTALVQGAEIPADTTQDTLELQQALDDVDRLVTALGPAELSAALGSAALALDGRGEQIGRVIDTADRYLGRITPRLGLVRTDLRKLAQNMAVVDRIAPDLLQATKDGLVTLDTVVTQRAAIAAIISGGSTLTANSRRFLDENTAALVQTLDNGSIMLDAIYDNRRIAISGSIATNIRLGKIVPGAVTEGFVEADGVIRLLAPPFYTRADRPDYGSGNPRSRSRSLADVSMTRLLTQGGR